MNKTAQQDNQKNFNIIRNQIDAVDADTKWAALELMLASSASVVILAKKMAKPNTKTITRTISIPKTKVSKQPAQQTSKTSANDAVRTAIKPITPQNRYPINNSVNQRLKILINARFSAVYHCL